MAEGLEVGLDVGLGVEGAGFVETPVDVGTSVIGATEDRRREGALDSPVSAWLARASRMGRHWTAMRSITLVRMQTDCAILVWVPKLSRRLPT